MDKSLIRIKEILNILKYNVDHLVLYSGDVYVENDTGYPQPISDYVCELRSLGVNINIIYSFTSTDISLARQELLVDIYRQLKNYVDQKEHPIRTWWYNNWSKVIPIAVSIISLTLSIISLIIKNR